MDKETWAHFVAHVREVEARSLAGDEHATKTLACMALLAEGFPPEDPDGGETVDLCEVIDFSKYRMAA